METREIYPLLEITYPWRENPDLKKSFQVFNVALRESLEKLIGDFSQARGLNSEKPRGQNYNLMLKETRKEMRSLFLPTYFFKKDLYLTLQNIIAQTQSTNNANDPFLTALQKLEETLNTDNTSEPFKLLEASYLNLVNTLIGIKHTGEEISTPPLKDFIHEVYQKASNPEALREEIRSKPKKSVLRKL